jgi:aspartate racemase
VKTIGLIGGMSWESSAEYYRTLNELVREEMGGLHSARCLLYSVDFAEIEQLQAAGAWEQAGELLATAAKSLEGAGADFLLLCTNTMHKVANVIEAAVSIPLVHIADVAADAIRAAGITRVGLLGTAFTMEESFYKDRLATHGLEVIVPSFADRIVVHRIIYEELCRGVIREESREHHRAIIGRLVAAGAEGVVLGCTELELLVRANDAPVPVFPTTRLHAAAAVHRALSQRDENDLELFEALPESEVAAQLLARYYEELAARFPGGFDVDRTVAAPSAELRPPSGCLLIVRLDGRAIGCGAVRKLDETTAEIKRMWIDPAVRGRGIGRRLLIGLESAAARLGCQLVRLDTSSHLPEALGLYRSTGYSEIPPYNDNRYAHHWFEKSLGSRGLAHAEMVEPPCRG